MSSDTKTLIQSIVERIERVNEDMKTLSYEKHDLYQEAKAQGLDVQSLKEVIKLRAKSPAERQIDDATVAAYCEALGIDLGRELKQGTSLDDLLHGSADDYPSDSARKAA